ncbi:MAG: hypothetical protein H0V17_20795 [Deltaproteobacteria bacterium]|nr:hypothetical protein [Deltaproteobacteria bacterium]
MALGLSFGGTAASWGALLAGGYSANYGLLFVGSVGALLGPSIGNWYAHEGFTRGLGIRLVGLGVAALGVLVALDSGFEGGEDRKVDVILVISAGLFVAGTIDDIATAPFAARKYNARFENVTVVPTANEHGGGVSLIGRF